jgi:murein DD-endopeptidase MepM/ murein hydrolase activator NlpD
MDRNPFGELQEGQVGSVQFNAPPIEQAPDLTAVNAGQNAQALLVAGRFLNFGANQLDAMDKQKIRALNANLKAKGQQLATSGLFDGQTMTAEEATAAGFTDQSFLEGYLKTRADVDLQTAGYELKREAENPNATEQSLAALSEQRIGQLKQKYNKYGAIGSTVFSEDVYKPLLTVANAVKLDGVKRDVQAIQADQEVMSRQSLDALFGNASGLASPEGAVVFNDAVQRQLDNAIKVHGEKGIKVFANNFVNSAVAAVNNGADMNSIKALLSISKVKLSNGTEVALSSLDADITNKLFEADKNKKSSDREDQKHARWGVEQRREDNNLSISNMVFQTKLAHPDWSDTAIANSAISEIIKQNGGTSGVDITKVAQGVKAANDIITPELKANIEVAQSAAKAGMKIPSHALNGTPEQNYAVIAAFNAETQQRATKQQELNRGSVKFEQAQQEVNREPYNNFGSQILTDNALRVVDPNQRSQFTNRFNTFSNGLLKTIDPATPQGRAAFKSGVDNWIDQQPNLSEAGKAELHKLNAIRNKQLGGSSTPSNQTTQFQVRSIQDTNKHVLGGAGKVSSQYGIRIDPITNQKKNHDGIDFKAPQGTSVRSAGNGKVIYAGVKGGYGNTVIIQHANGTQTLYAHLSKINVQQGSNVSGSTYIGAVGSTGRSTGSHLHFEVRRNGTPFKPYL